MKYIVAVSGGIDSVVLLDQLVWAREHELVVAHFDHGIRADSAADARFVEALAQHYHLPFVGTREELGSGASEELARRRRYGFLRAVAQEQAAVIATAHHADDVIETIAINLSRGTGWRGLAVLDASDIVRPLLHSSKQRLRQYALEHRLEWVEDSTNATSAYLRNRLRHTLQQKIDEKTRFALQNIRDAQTVCKAAINKETGQFLRRDATYDRHLLIQVDAVVGRELLWAIVRAACGVSLTRPQCERALLVIKTAQSSTRYECGGGVTLQFYRRTFIVETI